MRRALLLALCLLTAHISYSQLRLIDQKDFAFVHKESGTRIDFFTKVAALIEKLGPPSVSFEKPNRQGYKNYACERAPPPGFARI